LGRVWRITMVWRVVDWLRRQVPMFYDRKGTNDFVGVYDCSIETLEDILHENGCVPNPVSYVSYLKQYGHEASAWAYRESRFATWQYHIVLFTEHDGLRVYCHKEYNWMRHPIRHYKQMDISSPEAIRWCSKLLRESDVRQVPVDK